MEQTETNKVEEPCYIKLSTGQYIVFRPCEQIKKRIIPKNLKPPNFGGFKYFFKKINLINSLYVIS